MKALLLLLLCLVVGLDGRAAVAQSPTPSPPPTTSVPQFPSEPSSLRAWPGPRADSWYVYGSGFTPRTSWVLTEVVCDSLPCSPVGPTFTDYGQEEGTLTFYVQLPPSSASERLLAVVPGLEPPGVIPADAASVRVAGSNPGGGYGHPPGTLSGIPAVDEVIAVIQAVDTPALRARLVMKDGATTTGSAVRGLATWQCQPYTRSEELLDEFIDYDSGLVYAVFRIPNDESLPLRYHGASYGIVWAPYGENTLGGTPLGGSTLVDDSGQVVGLEARCGTTPGFHVRNFSDFVLAPFDGPPPPEAPNVGNSPGVNTPEPATALPVVAVAMALVAVHLWRRARR